MQPNERSHISSCRKEEAAGLSPCFREDRNMQPELHYSVHRNSAAVFDIPVVAAELILWSIVRPDRLSGLVKFCIENEQAEKMNQEQLVEDSQFTNHLQPNPNPSTTRAFSSVLLHVGTTLCAKTFIQTITVSDISVSTLSCTMSRQCHHWRRVWILTE